MKKLQIILSAIVWAGMTSLAVAQLDQQQKPAPQSKEQAAMEKAWMAYMTPGAMHEMLAKDNGEWTQDLSMWYKPNTEPEKMTAMCTNRMIMGNRYQESKVTGSYNGQPFEGVSITGYDNAKKVFISTWYDNMSTGIMYSEGTYDAATKTINMKGKSVDMMTGKEKTVRQVIKNVSDNSQVIEFYDMHEGKEFKSMEIKAARK